MFEQETFGSFVNGRWQKGGSAEPFISPVTKTKWKTLSPATDGEIEAAIEAVKKNPLREMSSYERADIINRIAALMTKNREELALCITMEMGKPIADARSEVDYGASYFLWFAEEAKRIYGKEIPSRSLGKRLYVRYEPIGACAVITPWNFPIAMAARKIAAAFAAGCPVISKPSSISPLSLLLLGALSHEAGIPKESIHILIGDGERIGRALLAAEHVRKLSFTGSCEVGKALYRQCAESVKKVTMELGGHAPLIVFDDADLERAVEGTFAAKFRISGQTCICANRLFIHKKILPDFLEGLIQKVKGMKIGDPLDEDTIFSTSIHPDSERKARAHIEDAIKRGARAHLGAKEPHEPEILTGITSDMVIFNEETFGPVAGIMEFEDEEEVIRLANQTPYGLASYLFTEGLRRAENVTSKLNFGIVGLNDGRPSAAELPFGGVKGSGFGREGGPSGIYEYLSEKVISEQL
ncbi:MAG: Succinate-semialdehyde dehydrogenase [NADP(+)] [Chlamydiae bacterium]|nr:Succinate-semialdehyde dehydrogenase [NADP(+)] [Chlamydiota bacterium]